MAHEPLSQSLDRLAAAEGVQTLNQLVELTEGRGIFLVSILLCLPFITPIPLPGLSNVVGLALVMVGVRLFLRLPTRLPDFVGARRWPANRMQQVIRGSQKLLRWLERVIKPRRTLWMTRGWALRLNALAFAFMAFLLALPIPPVMPFSNTLPAYSMILLCASMMEEDGAAIWFAYASCAFTLGYFILFAGVIVKFLVVFEERILGFLRDLL